MSFKSKWTVFAVALGLLGLGAALLSVARHLGDSAGSGGSAWGLVSLVLLGLLGIIGIVGAMAVVISALMPHALSAPDADELGEHQGPPNGKAEE